MSRVSAVAERIRLMILRGDLGPGSRLVDVQLAARLAAARVRDGLAPAFAVATLRDLAAAADAPRRCLEPDRAARADRNVHRAIAARPGDEEDAAQRAHRHVLG